MVGMDLYMWICRALYFILGIYFIMKCKETLCKCSNDSEEQPDAENDDNGENVDVDAAAIKARRRERVRECLDVRKIESRPSTRTVVVDAVESIGSREEDDDGKRKPPDLEKGEASPSTSNSTTHTRITVLSSASDDDDDDDDDSANSTSENNSSNSSNNNDNNNNDNRAKDRMRPFFSVLLHPKRRVDADADISGEDDDRIESSIRSDGSFWLRGLFNQSDGPSGEAEAAVPRDIQGEVDCCSICLEPYRVGDTLARLKRTRTTAMDPSEDIGERKTKSCCNHWFHEDCIIEWLQDHDDCPLCRVEMVHN